MADNKSREITMDLSEMITGLKAVQREAKKATQAVAELEATWRKEGDRPDMNVWFK